MFHPSSQHLSFRQQVISLNQSYPCPRCVSGVLEPYGLTETFHCKTCTRLFVPLKSGRYLYPAKNLGWKIAPTFWWDGFRWHWAGTTASACQLVAILFTSLAPVIVVNLAMFLGLWSQRPDWCHPLILSPIIGLIAIQLTYLAMWDFDFRTRAKDRSQEPSAHN